jgi:sugar lactone lactonase YvrE
LAGGFVFPEAARWHDGRWWLSDIHTHQVLTVDATGAVTPVATLGDRVSGLGFLPDGTPLVVSMLDRRLLALTADGPRVHADLANHCDWFCNDMVVDGAGRAYVGARNHGGGATAPKDAVLLVQPDGHVAVGAPGMQSPNGSVVTPDGTTLIVAETSQARLTAFTIAPDGTLGHRRVFASVPGLHPDGTCLDRDGAVWFGSPITQEFVRVHAGGRISDRIPAPGVWAVSGALGGPDRRTFFAITMDNSVENIERVGDDRTADVTSTSTGAVSTCPVDVPGAGWP